MVDKTLKWPLVHGNPLPTWISPSFKVIILGDAAHAMLPYMAQGAAMAVEDGAALAVVLNAIEDRFSIPLALKVWETERLRRTSQMQGASKLNSILLHCSDGPEQEARDEAMRLEVEGKHFLFSPNLYSDPITQQWAHGYDAEAEVQRAWDSDRIRVPDIML
jgi:salicylate hydroxylase